LHDPTRHFNRRTHHRAADRHPLIFSTFAALEPGHAMLDRYTLADIVANRQELARVLLVPAAREGRPA
jgi:hypothetical protein